MKTSAAMDEIREIRDRNSLMHLSQTKSEREQELKRSMEWFSAAMGNFSDKPRYNADTLEAFRECEEMLRTGNFKRYSNNEDMFTDIFAGDDDEI